MGATELQTKLYRSNTQFRDLAMLMTQQVYPKLFYLLNHLAIEEICYEVTGYKKFVFNVKGQLVFYNIASDSTRTDVFILDCAGKNICPLFEKGSLTNVKVYDSPIDGYINFCREIINSIKPLENKILSVNELILEIRSIGVTSNRFVIVEKI